MRYIVPELTLVSFTFRHQARSSVTLSLKMLDDRSMEKLNETKTLEFNFLIYLRRNTVIAATDACVIRFIDDRLCRTRNSWRSLPSPSRSFVCLSFLGQCARREKIRKFAIDEQIIFQWIGEATCRVRSYLSILHFNIIH